MISEAALAPRRPTDRMNLAVLVALLQPLLAYYKVRGIDLCIYDPALDTPDAPGAALLADILARSFSRGTST